MPLRILRAVRDLRGELVAAAEHLTHAPHDLLGMRVILGEDERLRHLTAAREDVSEQLVAIRLQDETDLRRRRHHPIELGGRIDDVLVERLHPLLTGPTIDQRHMRTRLDAAALSRHLRLDTEDLEVDVDAVRHRLLVRVLAHEVLPEECERLLAGRRGQADDVRVEVLEHGPPLPVDRAVRLVDDDEVARLGRQGGVVGDGHRLVGDLAVEHRVVALGDVLAAQRLEDALDRRDDDARRIGRSVALQLVDGVELGEAAAVVRRTEVGELGRRLIGQVVAVDEKQDALETAEPQ